MTRPARSTSRPASSASRAARSEAVTPAAQIAVARLDLLDLAVRGADRHRVGTDVDDGVARQHRDSELLERSRCLARERLRKGMKDPLGRLRRAGSARFVCRRSGSRARSASWASSAICPAISTPVGPPPTITKVSQPLPSFGLGLDFGGLEGGEDAAADVECAVERFQLGRMLLPLVVPEVGVVRAAGDDQRVVRRCRRPPLAVRARPSSTHLARVRSKPVTSARTTRAFALARQDRAQRRRDLGRRRAHRSRPGRRAAGRACSSAGRSASPRPARGGGRAPPGDPRSRHRRRRL